MQMSRPIITKGKTGIGNFGVAVMPDGTSDTLRVLIKPDGFHFVSSDFDDLVLPSVVFGSSNGTKYTLSFNDSGELLINDSVFTATTNQGDEIIAGNKTHMGSLIAKGGLELVSSSGKLFSVTVDDNGTLTAKGV